jgi:HEAT repeat protein
VLREHLSQDRFPFSADPVWADAVQADLSNGDPAMRYEAARACGELEVKEAISALIRLVSDPDREVQAAAIGALGQIGGTRARRVLERCRRSEDDALRAAAEDALGELLLGQQTLDLFLYTPWTDEDDEDIVSEL